MLLLLDWWLAWGAITSWMLCSLRFLVLCFTLDLCFLLWGFALHRGWGCLWV